MNHDFIRLANDVRRAHSLGIGFRLPAMTMRELSTLVALLADAPASTLLH